MIVCSNCKHANLAGAVFCAECGAQLAGKDSLSTQTITQNGSRDPKPAPAEETFQSFNGDESWATLHLLDTGQVLPLSARNEFTIGRVSAGQPIVPDIDLSPYRAYDAGVSRLHAVIKKDGSRLLFMDLGSSNGSFVNGKRLSPNMEQALQHGDIVALGKMKMQVLIKK
jgi:pSer/pThr/pTyr-binding forkhead associated (FHA) protein